MNELVETAKNLAPFLPLAKPVIDTILKPKLKSLESWLKTRKIDNEVYDYLKNQKIDLLGEITFSKDYASIYAQGEIIENMPESIKYQYDHIIEKLMQKLEDD